MKTYSTSVQGIRDLFEDITLGAKVIAQCPSVAHCQAVRNRLMMEVMSIICVSDLQIKKFGGYIEKLSVDDGCIILHVPDRDVPDGFERIELGFKK